MTILFNIFLIFKVLGSYIVSNKAAYKMKNKSYYSTLWSLISFIICFLFNVLGINSQSLNYRQGQFIVQADHNNNLESILQNGLRSRGRNVQVHLNKMLSKDWNIALIDFDFTKINEFELLNELKQLPGILQVQVNHILQSRKQPDDDFFTNQWHHLNEGLSGGTFNADFDSDLAWDLTTGGLTEEGDIIVVCVIDDGLDIHHPDLLDNLWLNRAEIPNNSIDDDLNGYIDDYYGWNTYLKNDSFALGIHGTPVCGLVAARGNNSLGVAGINWQVKLMFVAGGGDEANAIESYQYPWIARKAYNESKGKAGAFVVATNASWGSNYGRPEDAPIWCAIYDSLGSVGILNAAATANLDIDVDVLGDLPTTCESDYLVGVTNLNWFDIKDSRSAFGNISIDLGAYGENVFTTAPNNAYKAFAGTSAAAPQVAGAIGLLYSLPCNNLGQFRFTNPNQAALQVKSLLLNNVKPLASLKNKTVSGGALNLFNSLMGIQPFHAEEDINSIKFSLAQLASQYPVIIQYRVLGNMNWIELRMNSGLEYLIQGLESCTEYEFRIKGSCDRLKEAFSNPIKIRTKGCCLAPNKITLVESLSNEASFTMQLDPSIQKIGYLIRPKYSNKWDTIYIQTIVTPRIRIRGLQSCNQYDIQFFSICNDQITEYFKLLNVTTSGCEQCSSVDYCTRNRPNAEFEWLDHIAIDQQSFLNGNNSGYGNFIGTPFRWQLEKNIQHSIMITPGYLEDSSLVHMVAWIDFNQNGIFESSENILKPGLKSKKEELCIFTIPSNAILGITRMRIMVKYAENNIEAPTPCFQSLEFGEYEEYCVDISEDECLPIQSATIKKISNNEVMFEVDRGQSINELSYQYHRLYDPIWFFGTTKTAFIQLMNLDSCTEYELRIQTTCHLFNQKPLITQFKTTGAHCIVNTSDYVNLDINVFPNPCFDFFIIQSLKPIHIQQLQVFSLSGTEIPIQYHGLNTTDIRCDFISQEVSGIYFMKLTLKGGQQIIKKLIVN